MIKNTTLLWYDREYGWNDKWSDLRCFFLTQRWNIHETHKYSIFFLHLSFTYRTQPLTFELDYRWSNPISNRSKLPDRPNLLNQIPLTLHKWAPAKQTSLQVAMVWTRDLLFNVDKLCCISTLTISSKRKTRSPHWQAPSSLRNKLMCQT